MEDDFQMGGDGSQSEEEEEEDSARPTLEQRQIQRASGDHPLQERFREVSRQLLEKHGVRIPKGVLLLPHAPVIYALLCRSVALSLSHSCEYAGGANDQSDTEAEKSSDEESVDDGNPRGQEADNIALAGLEDAVTNDLPHRDLPASYPKPAVQDRGIT